MRKLQPLPAIFTSSFAAALFFSAAHVAFAASDTWSSSPSGVNWNSADWTGGNAPPQAGDALVFGSSSQTTLNNNFSAGTAFGGLYFTGVNAFILNGNSVLLSGPASNTVGVLNTSGQTQTFGTLPLSLDWGYHTFTTTSGGSVALNGGLTANTGGVAYFDANNTSSSLVNDSSGLISGLGGAGLIYSGTGSNFTGLATMSGTAIGTYSGWPSVVASPGVVGATTAAAAVNIEITGTGAGNNTFANGSGITYANTIFLANATNGPVVVGSTAGAQTLDLGAVSGVGGIYVPNGLNTAALTIGSGAQTILTAGPETGPATPGTIVFGINGTATNNVATMNSTIKDNLSGGTVTVVKTGTGVMTSGATLTNTYSGGTYVLGGEYIGNQVSAFGTGPIFVGPGASLYLQAGCVTYSNELYLSPGVGASTAISGSGGAFTWGSSANTDVTLAGKIHLLGAPAPNGPGCRFSSVATSKNLILTGQITGTGTLDIPQGGHSGNTILSNTAANNNFQGGIVLDPRSTLSVFFKMGANNQIPNGPGTGDFTIIAGSTGDVRFDLNGNNATINALNAPSSGQVAKQELSDFGTANSTLTMGANNNSGAFFGVTLDAAGRALSIVKIGTGTQTFNGASAFGYLGNTTVSNGTFALAANGQIPNSPVITVASAGTLDGSALSTGGLNIGSGQTLNCVGTIVGSTVINGTIESFDAIGTLNNNGDLILQSGGTNNWFINNATGTKGTDSGWALLNVSGTLQINSTDGSPFVINVNSLTLADAVGNAANFHSSSNYTWIIAQAGSISGFTDSGQFSVVTTGFANFPGSPSQWAVSQSGNNLVLTFTPSQVITSPLATPVTVNQGHDASFSVTANPLGTGTTFSWTQNANALANGGTSAGGNSGNVSISSVGNTSTLTIHGVDNAGPNLDGGTIAVTVNTTLGGPQQATSTATLNVEDAPYNPNVTQSGALANPNLGGYSAGSRTYLAATASGGINNSQDFTYQWYFGNTAISGATNSTLAVNISSAGNYYVVITDPAGNVTSSPTTISPVTAVPGQIIFEPFDSYAQQASFSQGHQPDVFSSSQEITNLFNQVTGEPAYWTVEGSTGNTAILVNGLGPSSTGENQFGGTYPWPGLGGSSPNEMYWTATTPNNHLRITTNGASLFAVGGPNTNIFFSFSMSIVSLGNGGNDGNQMVFGGFSTAAGPSACGLEFWTWDISAGSSSMHVGVGKGNGTAIGNPTTNDGNAIQLPNVVWGPANSSPLGSDVWTQQSIFVVGCYTVVDGPGGSNDTVSLWIDPPASSYYAQTPPTPYLGPTNFGGTVANSVPQDFALLNDFAPASHRITDLRIGTTWASVTPPAAPTFVMGNVYAPLGTTAVFESQNAGNPVTGGYGWQFNGGAALTDGPTGHGSTITGTSTGVLVISNVQAADLGTYTVNGTNTDVSTNSSGSLSGSASAILSSQPPRLSVVRSAPNVIVQWPTNWLGYVLEQSSSISPTSWSTNSLPPYPVSGTNNAVTVPATSKQFYRLINP